LTALRFLDDNEPSRLEHLGLHVRFCVGLSGVRHASQRRRVAAAPFRADMISPRVSAISTSGWGRTTPSRSLIEATLRPSLAPSTCREESCETPVLLDVYLF
jgi:hypothetical protein